MCKYAVVDLEMCNVPKENRSKNFHYGKEVIQIGAVLLSESLEVLDEFVTYVSPQYGFIDERIRKLTGITNRDVAGAPVFEEAMQAFLLWLPADTKVVSWSGTDEAQIRRELMEKGIVLEGVDGLYEGWIDCQKTFSNKMHSDRAYRLTDALVAADILFEDGAHNGLVDARNTALLFVKMEREPELVLNEYYRQSMSDKEEHCGFTLGSLLAGLDMSAFAVA